MILVIKDLKMFLSRNTIHLRINFFLEVKHSCLLNSNILKVMQVNAITLLLDTETKSSNN